MAVGHSFQGSGSNRTSTYEESSQSPVELRFLLRCLGQRVAHPLKHREPVEVEGSRQQYPMAICETDGTSISENRQRDRDQRRYTPPVATPRKGCRQRRGHKKHVAERNRRCDQIQLLTDGRAELGRKIGIHPWVDSHHVKAIPAPGRVLTVAKGVTEHRRHQPVVASRTGRFRLGIAPDSTTGPGTNPADLCHSASLLYCLVEPGLGGHRRWQLHQHARSVKASAVTLNGQLRHHRYEGRTTPIALQKLN